MRSGCANTRRKGTCLGRTAEATTAGRATVAVAKAFAAVLVASIAFGCGSNWCRFSLVDRSGLDCRLLTARDTGMSSTIATQYTAGDGTVWAAVTTWDGVVVRRWDGQTGSFAPEVVTSVMVGSCTTMLVP